MTTLSLQSSDDAGAGAILGVFLLIYFGLVLLTIVAMVKILQKAGYSGWWALVTIVPILNAVMFFVFAFSEWPVLRRLSYLEQVARQGYPPQGYSGQGYPGQGYPGQGYPQQPGG